MEVDELKVLISLRKMASAVMSGSREHFDIEIDGKQFKFSGKEAVQMANGMMVAVQMMEKSTGI